MTSPNGVKASTVSSPALTLTIFSLTDSHLEIRSWCVIVHNHVDLNLPQCFLQLGHAGKGDQNASHLWIVQHP